MKIVYSEHYGEDYWLGRKTYGPDRQTYHGPGLDWSFWEHIAKVLHALMPGVHTGLDVGCGGAGLAARMLGQGWEMYGADVSEYAVANCIESMRERVACIDLTTLPSELLSYHGKKVLPSVFDAVIATDFLEHIYEEDLDVVLRWLRARADRFFFCIGTTADPSRGTVAKDFSLRKGTPVPPEYEATAVAGHVNVRSFSYWTRKLQASGFNVEWEPMYQLQRAREMSKPWRETWGWHMGATIMASSR